MKKNQLKIALMVLFSMIFIGAVTIPSATAQFSLGLKVSGNTANYKGLTDRNIGLEAGVFMRFGKGFFFQPEVNYSFKRSSFKDNLEDYPSDELLKQHYVSVPVLLGYHFINNDNFKFRLTAGPRFDFKVSDNMDDLAWDSNSMQWGGQFGVGVDFWRFALDFSYCVAADNFRNIVEGTTQAKMLNMFILSLGFKIVK